MLWRVQAFNLFARQMQLSLLTRLSHLPVDLTKALNCVVFTALAVAACSEFPKMIDMQERSVEGGEGRGVVVPPRPPYLSVSSD